MVPWCGGVPIRDSSDLLAVMGDALYETALREGLAHRWPCACHACGPTGRDLFTDIATAHQVERGI